MINALLFDPVSNTFEQGGSELIDLWQKSLSAVIWLDIETEPAEIETELLNRFKVHPLAIQDALRGRHPPKLEVFDDHLFILLRGLDADTNGINFGVIQLGLFVGKRFFITRHVRRSTSASWLMQKVTEDPTWLQNGPGDLALRLANRLVRRYVEILLAFEPRLDEIETEIFGNANDSLLAELTRYKSKLREIGRIARYHLQITRQMRDEAMELLGQELAHELTDLSEQVERTVSLTDLYYETARDLTDGYMALSTHRLNRVMQILTVITVVFVPLTFIAGIYGMNFENMPELSSRSGYFIVLGVMVSIGISLLFLFRRKGWV